jgi:hypothetical protein
MKLRTFRVKVQLVVVIAPAHLTIFSANYIPIAGNGQYCVKCMEMYALAVAQRPGWH